MFVSKADLQFARLASESIPASLYGTFRVRPRLIRSRLYWLARAQLHRQVTLFAW